MKMIKILGIAAVFLVILILIGANLGAGFLERKLNRVKPHEPYPISPEVAKIHKGLVIGDWHADSLLWARDLSKRSDRGHVDIPRLAAGNGAIQMFTVVTKSPKGQNYDKNTGDSDNITMLALVQFWPPSTYFSLLGRALYQSKKLHRLAAEAPERVRIVRNQRDFQKALSDRARAIADGKPALVISLLGLEGCHALEGKLENVQVLYDAGFRMVGLHHFFDNKLGSSLHGLADSGLTEFGRQVVKKLNNLDVIIDMAHSSPKVVEDVLELSDRPVVISHTGVHGLCKIKRNIPDALMKKIAEKGGIIAIGYWDAVCDTTPEGVVKSIRYAIDLVGEDHVSLGSDYDGTTETTFDASELAVLTQAMMNAGFRDQEISKVMGGNMVRFLEEQLPK